MIYLPFGFSKKDFVSVALIFAFLIIAIVLNLQVSMRKNRDLQRKNDIRAIHDALFSYQNDFGRFPLSDSEGRVLACINDMSNVKTDSFGNVIYDACEWGKDSLGDAFDEDYPKYLNTLPSDPLPKSGRKYFYQATESRFQIYTSLESSQEPEYNESIVSRNLPCGSKICNAGRAFEITPLDKSIEEYENELRERYLYE